MWLVASARRTEKGTNNPSITFTFVFFFLLNKAWVNVSTHMEFITTLRDVTKFSCPKSSTLILREGNQL